jgi:hypothetical protein
MRTTDAPRTEVSDREGRFARDETTQHTDADDGLGDAVAVPAGGLRHRLRTNAATRTPYRVGVFVVGLLFIVTGFALAVLPGPLTIPPLLVGLWIWSTEFAFAKRFFDSVKAKADEAWCHAKKHPVSSAVMTIGGLIAAGVAFWAVQHYELVDKAKASIF